MSVPHPITRSLIVGTRGSALARRQTDLVIDLLRNYAPSNLIEARIITTAGDRDQARPLVEFGALGVFTTELENALRVREIDIAVHSLKDLPTHLADDLPIAAVLERADARDVLISRHGLGLMQLPHGACVGTSSVRRAAQLRALRPDITIVPLRGNVDTRLKKAATEEYDAIVLAAAGLLRLGREAAITEYFSVEQMTPDPGQGALAVQVRAGDDATMALVSQLDHAPTRRAVSAERAFLNTLGGGCRTPMAAYAEQRGHRMHLVGMVASPDGHTLVRGELTGTADQPEVLGAELAGRIRVQGVGTLLSSTGGSPLYGKRIVVTRALSQAEELAQKIRALGGEPVSFATIAFAPVEDFRELDHQITRFGEFDWIVFTSANGVRAVADRLRTLGLEFTIPAGASTAAIGTGTAKVLAELGIRVDFVPTRFLGAQIARELVAAPHARILLLRADLASDELAQALAARGFIVTDVDAYRTIPAYPSPIDWRRVDAVTFTSASTVNHCWERLDDAERARLADLDIFCIGPVTAQAARDLGLPIAATAAEHTLTGLVDTLVAFYERNFDAC